MPQDRECRAVGVIGRCGVPDDEGGWARARPDPVGVKTLEGEPVRRCGGDGVGLGDAGGEPDERVETRGDALDLAGGERADQAVPALAVCEPAAADVTVVGA